MKKFCLSDPWDYEDEDGTPVDEPFEPMVDWGGRPPELQIGQALGLCINYEEYYVLPDQARPHYRASVKEQLPHSRVMLHVPEFDTVTVDLVRRFGQGKSIGSDQRYWAWDFIERRMGYSRELKDVTYKDMGGNLYVAKRQHQIYYERVKQVMPSLGIKDWYITDGVLDDWLYGTYKPPHFKSL